MAILSKIWYNTNKKRLSMPKKLEKCVSAVQKQGKSTGSAYAICNASIGTTKKKKKK